MEKLKEIHDNHIFKFKVLGYSEKNELLTNGIRRFYFNQDFLYKDNYLKYLKYITYKELNKSNYEYLTRSLVHHENSFNHKYIIHKDNEHSYNEKREYIEEIDRVKEFINEYRKSNEKCKIDIIKSRQFLNTQFELLNKVKNFTHEETHDTSNCITFPHKETDEVSIKPDNIECHKKKLKIK